MSGMQFPKLITALLLCLLAPLPFASADQGWRLPQLPPPSQFGNLLINRTSTANKIKPATFSHWVHRARFTCRVCHGELNFAMKLNTTEITEAANRWGKFCGANGCHDGKAAFGHDRANCEKCHNGDLDYSQGKFAALARLPQSEFGNRINWVTALAEKAITPATRLKTASPDMKHDTTLELSAEWEFVPPAKFPHKEHTAWLDCDSCHPEIFTVKKKGTSGFTMEEILKGRYCGYCHLNVAFPMNDCKRCHPGLKNW
jgi:c(7)-type cytochrome triheme protein